MEDQTVKDAYKAKGIGARIGWGKRPAVIVVDLAKAFTDPNCPLGGEVSFAVEETLRILTVAREIDMPIFFTSVAYHNPEIEGGVFVAKIPALRILKYGSEWVQIDPRLQRRDNEIIIYKEYSSSFFGTHLHSILHSLGVDTIIICGASTSGCIRLTAADGIQLGYRCIIPETAVCDRAEGPHKANLFDMDSKYGDVVTTDSVVAKLHEFA